MARTFAGGTDKVSLGTSTVFMAPEMTFAAWVKGTTFTNAYNSVMAREGPGTGGVTLLVKSTGRLAIYVYDTAVTAISYDPGTITLSTGKWYHVALTYRAGDRLYGYVNGVVDSSAAATANRLAYTFSADYLIGNSTASPRGWQGQIADATIWRMALSRGEMVMLSQGVSPLRIRPDQLVSYIPLDGTNREPTYGRMGGLMAAVPAVTGTVGAAGPFGNQTLPRSKRKSLVVV